MQKNALSLTFPALANPIRRAILARLATAETSVSELALPFDMSLPDYASMDQGVGATLDQLRAYLASL